MNTNDHLYQQIKKDLIKAIENGTYEIGDKLPSENEIVQRRKVSRNTARKVLEDMVKEGYAKRVQGKGSFVENTKINQSLSGIRSLSELFRSNNRETHSKLIDCSVIEATVSMKKKLRLNEEDKIIRIYKVRYADNEPAILNEVLLSYDRFKTILNYDVELLSLYDYFFLKEKVYVEKVEETLDIALLYKDEATLLNQKPGDPAFLLKGVTYDNTGKPFEIVKSIYRADLFQFSITLNN